MAIKTWGMCAGALVCGMTFGGKAMAQTAPAPVAPPPAAAPAPAAPVAAQPAAPAPVAAPPAQPGAVPPGYMLVPAQSPQAQTQYQVQYPQQKGALPPGMELPYEEGDPIPPGYRVAKQPRRGLITGGAIMTGIGWSLSLTAAVAADFEDKTGYLVVPVLGPWLMLATGGAKDDCYSYSATSSYCDNNAGLRSVLVLDGLLQTAGAIMIVAGAAIPKVRLVREDITVGFVPTTFGAGSAGIGAVGSF